MEYFQDSPLMAYKRKASPHKYSRSHELQHDIAPWSQQINENMGLNSQYRFDNHQRYLFAKNRNNSERKKVDIQILPQLQDFNNKKLKKDNKKQDHRIQKLNKTLNLSKIEFLAGKQQQDSTDTTLNSNQYNFLTRNNFYSKLQYRTKKTHEQKFIETISTTKEKIQNQDSMKFMVVQSYDQCGSMILKTESPIDEIDKDNRKIHSRKNSKGQTIFLPLRNTYGGRMWLNKSALGQYTHCKTIDSTKQSTSRQTSYEAYKKNQRKVVSQQISLENELNKPSYPIPIIITQKKIMTDPYLNSKDEIKQTLRLLQLQQAQTMDMSKSNNENYQQNQHQISIYTQFKNSENDDLEISPRLKQSTNPYVTLPKRSIEHKLKEEKNMMIERLKKLKSKNSIQKSFESLYPQLSQRKFLSKIQIFPTHEMYEDKYVNEKDRINIDRKNNSNAKQIVQIKHVIPRMAINSSKSTNVAKLLTHYRKFKNKNNDFMTLK